MPLREPLQRSQIRASSGCAEPFRASMREACRAFVSAPRAAFVPVGASSPEGVTGAGRRRGKPSGLRRGGVPPRSIGGTPMTRRRFRGLRRSRRDNPPNRPLSPSDRFSFSCGGPATVRNLSDRLLHPPNDLFKYLKPPGDKRRHMASPTCLPAKVRRTPAPSTSEGRALLGNAQTSPSGRSSRCACGRA